MRIELDQEDEQLLRSALEARLDQLRRELVHTDDRSLHQALARDVTRLEELTRRVAQPS